MSVSTFGFDVFLSYSSKDKGIVRPLAERLSQDGLKVWFDEGQIRPGDNIPAKIEEGLERSRVLVFCMSAQAFGSDWATLERQTFLFRDPLNKERRFVPLLLDATPIRGSLAQFHYVSWLPEKREDEYARLLGACRPPFVEEEVAGQHDPTLYEASSKPAKPLDGSMEESAGSISKDAAKRQQAEGTGIAQAIGQNAKAIVHYHYHGISPQEVQLLLATVEQERAKTAAPMPIAQDTAVKKDENAPKRRRWKFLLILIGAVALLAGALLWRYVVKQKRLAESRRLATESLLHETGELDLALLLSIYAFKTADTFEARKALLETIQKDPQMVTSLPHPSGVRSVAFSSDGKTLASAGDGGIVQLWGGFEYREKGKALQGHSGIVYGLAFDPKHGEILASGGADGTVRLWNVSSGKQIGNPLRGHSSHVVSVAFSRDGKKLATADLEGVLVVWDVETLDRPHKIGAPVKLNGAISSLAFSPDEHNLAVAGEKGLLMLVDATTKRKVGSFIGHRGHVWSVAFSPDGQMLASGGEDRTVLLWNVAERRTVQRVDRHKNGVRGVAFSPDGMTLASTGEDRKVILWNIPKKTQLGESLGGHDGNVLSVAFSADGKKLASASADRTVRIWRVNEDWFLGIAVDAHQETDVSQNVDTHREACEPSDVVESVAFSPDGAIFASVGGDKKLRLWEATKGKLLMTLSGHAEAVYTVAFSPDSHKKILASASCDRTVRLWDFATGNAEEVLYDHTDRVYAVAFSPTDGKLLASAGQDGTVRLWDLTTRPAVGRILGSQGKAVYALAFDPTGRTLASAGADSKVVVWDVTTRKAKAPLEGNSGRVGSLAFSPDGRLLASGAAGSLIIWNVRDQKMDGQPLLFPGLNNLVNAVAFSPDGRTLASGSSDKRVRLWDVASHQEIGELAPSNDGAVLSLAFNNKGTVLVSAGSHNSIQLWDLDPHSWIDRACERANRNLSLIEFQRYVGKSYRETCPELPTGEGVSIK
jgi:WD40 repeat protein